VRRGETSRDAWLPPGAWVDLADYVVYDGGKHATIPAPLAKLPLLIKDGGIVPMLDASIDTLAPATDPTVVTKEKVADRLDVVVALSPGKEALFTLADGTMLSAKRNAAGGAAGGAASGYATVPVEQIAMCDGKPAAEGCLFTNAEGMVARLRITTPLAAATDVSQDDLVLSARGPSARRVRWDVLRVR